ncbi:hypothetical protein BCV70DRAFT_162873 [Testicularia cyperi]|uniref:Helicase SWR1 n=1 Tax=Testicularia cyperi TaxID=1882483 RepID=A0A317XN58_9BASI|nr:hypothetical protein BCV70DRAFT_162873 [Testicularia cyperi]
MSNGPALRPSSPDHESSVAPVTTGADGLSPSSVTSISNHIQQKEVTLAASIADDGLAGGSNEDGARHPDVTAASTEANNGTHPRPKRRRLDAELAFSSPGPAFRIQLSGDDQHTGRNDDSPGGKDGRRASRSLRVRRSITQVNESLNNSSASNSDAKKGGAANGTVAQPAHTLSAGSEQTGPSASSNTSKATAPVNLDSADNASVNSANTVKRERSRSASPTAPSAPADDTLEDPSSLPLITAPPRTKPTITPITALTGDVPFPEILSKRRQEKVALAQSDLEEVHEDHDLLVRELFHLTKFVTMVGYDPEVARQDKSDVFTTFQQSHDLRFALDPTDGPSSSTSGRATRRSVNARLQSLSLKRALPPPPAPATPSSSSKTAQAMTNGKDSARKRTRRSSSLLDSDRSSVVAGKARARDANDDANSDEDGSATPSNGRRSSVVLRNGSIDAANSPQAAKPKRSGRKSKIMDNLDAFIERHRPRPLPDHPPPLRILAPHHVPQPSRFGGNLEAFWESFSLLHDDNITAEAASELERAELDAYLRVDQSRREGFLPNEGHAAENVRLSAHQMVRKKAHHDHLLEAVSSGYASMRQNTKHRQQLAKRVARMVAQHWDRQSGSSERERKAEEKRVRALARWTIKEVGKQWRLAVNVVRARKAAAEKAEKEKLDKAQLNAILEQSTQMLRKQQEEMARLDGHDDSGSERSLYDSDSDSIGASSKESQIELSDTPDEDEDASDEESLMLAEDDEDDSEDAGLAADADVPIEELLKRYGYPAPGASQTDISQRPSATARSSRPRRRARSSSSTPSISTLDPDANDVDFSAESDQDGEDVDLDRQMLEDDQTDDNSSEDAGLAADASVPIEELLKRYGYQQQSTDASDVYSMDDDESSEDDEDERSGKDDAMTSSETGLTLSLIKADSDADVESDAIEEQNERASSLAPSSSRETPDAALVDESDTESTATSSRRSHRRSTTRASSAVSSDRNQARSRQPFLLRGQLRPYQQIGFEWLAGLYANGVNGILADEMGLGKTIQTISLLAHLACDKGVWGPHLVVAPTSVMLNWEVEFKKFLPGFKILSYYGNQRERKEKRVGWNTENSFNVCITSYQLVLADQHIFRRKPWVYLVLDEAHHIKNFRSQRWQTLLGFNSQRRLLLTGTPLQNNLMDLWSLMYFLMPHGATELPGGGAFANMKDFQEWFSNPLNKAIEGGTSMDEETRAMVSKLHTVLRPFLLRRLKSEVEKELPSKYEHVITCRLSKRQRFLYNDFMSRAKTRESLASGNYLSIINCLMQLRKVCNHPDLFEVRPIVTSFAMQKSVIADYEIKDLLVRRRLLRHEHDLINKVDLSATNFVFTDREQHLTAIESRDLRRLNAATKLPHFREKVPALPELDTWTIDGFARTREQRSQIETMERWKHRAYVNQYRCTKRPVYGAGLISLLRQAGEPKRLLPLECHEPKRKGFLNRCDTLLRAIKSYPARQEAMQSTIDRFVFATPRAVAVDMPRWALAGFEPYQCPDIVQPQFDTLHPVAVKLHIAFPDASLLQYDCGKLQQLNILMRRLKEGGHRILIFTQMTRVLDILESFLNFHGYRYLRLDGQTKVEHRQALTEKFNRDLRISAFILSTRSGGLGINLTGADTVLFYDLDWNAAIEAQCMDRAHRIGQTRDVHIYRFVTEHTIEENMLKKANQKRLLDSVVIQEGEFNTDAMAKKIDWRDMLDDGGKLGDVEVEAAFDGSGGVAGAGARDVEKAFLDAEDEEDRQAALAARQEMFIDESDFSEQQQQQAQQGQQQKSADGSNGTPMLETPDDAVVEAEAEEEEEEGGTIDDYMLKFVEWDWDFFA